MSWLLEFLERLGTGMTIFFYEAGNPKSEEEVRKIAQEQSRNNFMLFPRPIGLEKQGAGVERVEVSAKGSEVLFKLVNDYFDSYIRSFILGQTLSSQAQSTGLGSAVAEFHQKTLYRILKYDAINLQETLTKDFVGVLLKYNRPNLPERCIKLIFDLDHPQPKELLECAKLFQQMGGDLDMDQVRSSTGFTKPKRGAPTLKGHDYIVSAQTAPPPGSNPFSKEAFGEKSKDTDGGKDKMPPTGHDNTGGA
jgi:phage gp29-like protein